jgi:hypothetical protein
MSTIFGEYIENHSTGDLLFSDSSSAADLAQHNKRRSHPTVRPACLRECLLGQAADHDQPASKASSTT